MNLSYGSDEELRSRIFTIKDPEALPDLLTQIPADRGMPIIEYAYDLTPGKAQKRKRERVYCAHCGSRTHYRGYVVKWSDTERCLVGIICGANHYGADFNATELEFRNQRNRKAQLQRYDAILSLLPYAISAVKDILSYPSIQQFERLVFDMQRQAPDAWHSLASVGTKGGLYVEELVRDIEAEARLSDEELERRKAESNERIYKNIQKSVGILIGGAFFTTPSDQVGYSLRTSHKKMHDAYDYLTCTKTDQITKEKLKRTLDSIVDIVEEVAAYDARMAGAKAFFSSKNLAIVADWLNLNSNSKGTFKRVGKKLKFYSRFTSGEVTFSIPDGFVVPKEFEELRKFRAEVSKF